MCHYLIRYKLVNSLKVQVLSVLNIVIHLGNKTCFEFSVILFFMFIFCNSVILVAKNLASGRKVESISTFRQENFFDIFQCDDQNLSTAHVSSRIISTIVIKSSSGDSA